MRNWYFDSIHRDKSNNISYANIYLYTLINMLLMVKLIYFNNAHSQIVTNILERRDIYVNLLLQWSLN
jgi:hypothetical protein